MGSLNSPDGIFVVIICLVFGIAMTVFFIGIIAVMLKEIMFPNWQQKAQFIIQKERLPADEANHLLVTANHPFQLFCRFVWGLVCLGFILALAVYFVQVLRPTREASLEISRQFWAYYITACVLTPVFIGLWLSLGPRAIEASHRLDRLFYRSDLLDSEGESFMQGLVKRGVSGIRHFGLLWLLIGILIAYHYFPHPGLPDLFDLRHAALSADQ